MSSHAEIEEACGMGAESLLNAFSSFLDKTEDLVEFGGEEVQGC